MYVMNSSTTQRVLDGIVPLVIVLLTIAAVISIGYGTYLCVAATCRVCVDAASRTKKWLWLAPEKVTLEVEEEVEQMVDLTTADGELVCRGGLWVVKYQVAATTYIVPVGPPNAPDFIGAKEQATSAIVVDVPQAAALKSAACLATFYDHSSGVPRLIGQATYAVIPWKKAPKMLLMTVHEWDSIQAMLETGSNIVLQGPRQAAKVTADHLKVMSRNGSAVEGPDVAVIQLEERLPAFLGLKAATISRPSRKVVPIVYWRDSHLAWKASPAVEWTRQGTWQRVHSASTTPGVSGAPCLLPGGKLVGLHTGAAPLPSRNYATDLSVLFPSLGPKKESAPGSFDDLAVDDLADASQIRTVLSDPHSLQVYFEDAQGRVGIADRLNFVDAKGRTWADIEDDDDDTPLSFYSKEEWERRRIAETNEVSEAMDSGQADISTGGKRAKRAALEARQSAHLPPHPSSMKEQATQPVATPPQQLQGGPTGKEAAAPAESPSAADPAALVAQPEPEPDAKRSDERPAETQPPQDTPVAGPKVVGEKAKAEPKKKRRNRKTKAKQETPVDAGPTSASVQVKLTDAAMVIQAPVDKMEAALGEVRQQALSHAEWPMSFVKNLESAITRIGKLPKGGSMMTVSIPKPDFQKSAAPTAPGPARPTSSSRCPQ